MFDANFTPEKITVESKQGENSEEISLEMVEEEIKSGNLNESIVEDAPKLAEDINRIDALERGVVKPREGNELNKLRAKVQDVVGRHLSQLKPHLFNVQRDYAAEVRNKTTPPYFDKYISELTKHISSKETKDQMRAYLDNYPLIIGIENHVRSVRRAGERRKKEVVGTDMDPFATMRIGSSELLDANHKVDLCNLRWMSKKNVPQRYHPDFLGGETGEWLRLSLIQAKTLFPDQVEVEEIRAAHKQIATRIFQEPQLYAELSDVQPQFEEIVSNAVSDIGGDFMERYQSAPGKALLETVAAYDIPALAQGRVLELTADEISEKNKRDLKSDIRTLFVLKEELSDQLEEPQSQFIDTIHERVVQREMGVAENISDEKLTSLIATAFQEALDRLDEGKMLSAQPLEIYSEIDASKSRYGSDDTYNRQRLDLDKNTFGTYIIKTGDLAQMVREHNLFS